MDNTTEQTFCQSYADDNGITRNCGKCAIHDDNRRDMECPECGSLAYLNLFPNYFAGIWNCTNIDCVASDVCDHEHKHVETAQVDFYPTNDRDLSYEVDVYVCDDCLKTIPLSDADPAQDRATQLLEAF